MQELITQMSIEQSYFFGVDTCLYCRREWIGKRRLLRHGKYRACELCIGRVREGLVHYRPSSGTEWGIFQSRCEQCRHDTGDDDSFPDPQKGALCRWGISDRIMLGMFEPDDSNVFWHDPENLRAHAENGRPLCPAECKRFTPDDYEHGDRDPAPTPDPNQMTFDDLDVPAEGVAEKREATT